MLGVAQFPWDPPPPQPQTPVSATVPSNAPRPQPVSSSSSMSNIPAQVPQIKTEPGVPPPVNGLGSNPPNRAAQNAAQNLEQKFGIQAQAQVQQLTGGQHPQVMNRPPVQQYQGQGQGQMQHPGQQQQQQPRAPLGPGQTDGAGDEAEKDPLAIWKAEVARRREEMAANNGQADRLIRERLLAMQSRMEGGGLLLSLEERKKTQLKSRKASTALHQSEMEFIPESSTTAPTAALPGSQFDGAGDEDDEDAINSDLDDPDELDGAGEDENDESVGNVMLCTYEKVQRVKNKWKCTLKDGTLWTNNKEWVFMSRIALLCNLAD